MMQGPIPYGDEPNLEAQMLAMLTAYQMSQAVGTLAKLGIADAFGRRSRQAAEVAKELGADADAVERLIRCCATAGLFKPASDGRWRLTQLGATLRSDAPGRVRDFAISVTSPGHWLPWVALEDAVRSGKPVVEQVLGMSLWEYYESQPSELEHFAGQMAAISKLVSQALPSVFDATDYRTIIDVGGSHGIILEALLEMAPLARGVIYDLPAVAESARASLAARGLANRVEFIEGDFFKAIPPGGDLYVLKHILHDWADEQALTILNNIRAVVEPGTKLLALEMVLPDPFVPSRASMVDLVMLTVLGGRERTRAEYENLFLSSGFVLERLGEAGPMNLMESVAV